MSKFFDFFNLNKRAEFYKFIEQSKVLAKNGDIEGALNYVESALILYPGNILASNLHKQYLNIKSQTPSKLQRKMDVQPNINDTAILRLDDQLKRGAISKERYDKIKKNVYKINSTRGDQQKKKSENIEIKSNNRQELKYIPRNFEFVKNKLKIGISYNEVIEILGNPTDTGTGESEILGGSGPVIGTFTSRKGMSDTLNEIRSTSFCYWDRPEGTYNLTFTYGKLTNIYRIIPKEDFKESRSRLIAEADQEYRNMNFESYELPDRDMWPNEDDIKARYDEHQKHRNIATKSRATIAEEELDQMKKRLH